MGDTTVVVPAEEGADTKGQQSTEFAAGVAAATSQQAAQEAQGAAMTAEAAQDTAQAAVQEASAAAEAAYDAQADVAALRSEMTQGFEAVTGALAAVVDRLPAAPAAEQAPAPPTKAEREAEKPAEKAPTEKGPARRRGFGAWATG